MYHNQSTSTHGDMRNSRQLRVSTWKRGARAVTAATRLQHVATRCHVYRIRAHKIQLTRTCLHWKFAPGSRWCVELRWKRVAQCPTQQRVSTRCQRVERVCKLSCKGSCSQSIWFSGSKNTYINYWWCVLSGNKWWCKFRGCSSRKFIGGSYKYYSKLSCRQ